MSYSDTKALEILIQVIGDVNSIDINRWFPLAHFVATRLRGEISNGAAKMLIQNGLSLHEVIDERYSRAGEYGLLLGQTPTSLAFRYSLSFFNFRQLLRDCGVNIEQFVVDELNEGPLRDARWTQKSLQAVFDLDFSPENMPAISCQCAGHVGDQTAWSFGREPWWELVLSMLKNDNDSSKMDRIMQETLKIKLGGMGSEIGTCYSCQLKESRQTSTEDAAEEEDSPFLFKTDFSIL